MPPWWTLKNHKLAKLYIEEKQNLKRILKDTKNTKMKILNYHKRLHILSHQIIVHYHFYEVICN